MASEKQIAANRLNAQKSTGPRSDAGKSQSALNARKHGFAGASFTVVRLEDFQAIDHLRQDALDLYRPVNSQEIFAVERIALCQMALLRAARLEAGMWNTCLLRTSGSDDDQVPSLSAQSVPGGNLHILAAQNRNLALNAGFHMDTRKPHAWQLFLRYQAQAERQYRRAVEELERLRALRSEFAEAETEEFPNEPNFPPQPESPEPDTVAETNPIPPAAAPPALEPRAQAGPLAPALESGTSGAEVASNILVNL